MYIVLEFVKNYQAAMVSSKISDSHKAIEFCQDTVGWSLHLPSDFVYKLNANQMKKWSSWEDTYWLSLGISAGEVDSCQT